MSVADIFEQMAQNAGRTQLARGALLGNAIAGISAVPGQIMDDRERQAVIDAARARLQAQDARGAAQDARQAANDQRDQAAAQAAAQRHATVQAGLLAAMGPSGDPTGPFDARAAFAAVSQRGDPSAIQDVIAAHRGMQAPVTQTDPTKDTRTDGVITTPAVAKAPEMGTPAYEIYARQQALLNPSAPPAAAPPSALLPGTMATLPPLTAAGTTAPPAPTDHAGDPSWTRADGTPKGNGFLGVLQRPDGKVSSEISIGVMINGKETEVPTLVPTLTAVEKGWLLTHDISDPSKIPMSIQQKAVDFAKTRIAAGKSPFAGPEDGPAAPAAAPGLTPNAAALQAYADQRTATAAAAAQAPAAIETARHNRETERISNLTAGREIAAQRETARHNAATEKAADPFGGGAPGGPSGADLLDKMPADQRAQSQALVDGKRQLDPRLASTPYGRTIINGAYALDPTFDQGNYNARFKARTDLTNPGGTGGKTIGALNTAIQHAGKLSDLIETLDNSNVPLVNAVVNPIKTATGSTAVTNFDTVAPQLAKEIERVWRGAGGTAGEIHDLIETIGHNKGKQQQREALQQFVELAKGKLDAVETQRDNVMGKTAGATIPILFPQNQPIVDRIAQRASGQPATPATAAPATAAPIDGQTGSVNGVPAVWKTVNGTPGWYAR